MKSRLPRRYDATVRTLKQLMGSKVEKVRLQAAMRLSDILLEHDRSVERKEIARDRAQSRLEIAALEQAARETPETVQADPEADAVAKIGADAKSAVSEYLAQFTKSAQSV